MKYALQIYRYIHNQGLDEQGPPYAVKYPYFHMPHKWNI